MRSNSERKIGVFSGHSCWKVRLLPIKSETIVWIFKIIKVYCFYPPRILDKHWCTYSCLQIPPRENWFQYVRRVYATAINYPCISTLSKTRLVLLCFGYNKWGGGRFLYFELELLKKTQFLNSFAHWLKSILFLFKNLET